MDYVLATAAKDEAERKAALENYDNAYASLRMAYSHMFMTGYVLSGAIVTQFNEKFHDPQTVPSPKLTFLYDI